MADHYKGMPVEDICKLNVGSIADVNSILFMWATYPKLKEALQVIEAWGFTYKTIAFQWIKLNPKSGTPFFGLGRWTRGNTEPCLLATKGKPKRISPSVSQLIQAPRGKHSAKPAIVRNEIIRLVGDLPRIELFARENPKGWDVFGNEVKSDVNL